MNRRVEISYFVCGLLGVIFLFGFRNGIACIPAVLLGLSQVFLIRKDLKTGELTEKERKCLRWINGLSLLFWVGASVVCYLLMESWQVGLWFLLSSYLFLLFRGVLVGFCFRKR